MSDNSTSLHLPARDIPIPTSVSAEAQAVIAMPRMGGDEEFPPPDDADGWRKMITARDEMIASMIGDRASGAPVTIEDRDLGTCCAYDVAPAGLEGDDRGVYLDIHGGGFVFGGGEVCRIMAINTAVRMGVHVCAVDYRMPPDHPFPAGLDDCVSAYRQLLREHQPEQIVIGGASAGGNLAAALALKARDEGLPLPASLVLHTPAVDLTGSGDSYQTNLGLDPLLPGTATESFLLYAAGGDLNDPYISPLNGDFTKGFPPAILTTGTRDRLLSDTVRMHRALRVAGMVADLHVTEAAGHGGFMGLAPEDDQLFHEVRRFLDAYWCRTARLA